MSSADEFDDPLEPGGGLRERLTRQSEEALGKIAEELVGNPLIGAAVSRAFDAREKAVQAQETAMGALNIPSSADIERLTRRLRSVSQRLEGIEDAMDRIDERLDDIGRRSQAVAQPPDVARRLDEIARDLAALRDAVVPGEELPPRSQERLTVPGPDQLSTGPPAASPRGRAGGKSAAAPKKTGAAKPRKTPARKPAAAKPRRTPAAKKKSPAAKR